MLIIILAQFYCVKKLEIPCKGGNSPYEEVNNGHHPTIDHRNRAAAGHLGSALHLPVFRMLKENAERETQYQQMINHLSTNVVEGIADINDKLDDMARRLDNPSA